MGCASARHSVINNGHDVAVLIACEKRDLVLESPPFLCRRTLFGEKLQSDRCSFWTLATVNYSCSALTDQGVDHIDTESSFEREWFPKL
jgi:hypothetical protein